ncbi:MAG: LptA/OstA family protein [Francisella sp.]
MLLARLLIIILLLISSLSFSNTQNKNNKNNPIYNSSSSIQEKNTNNDEKEDNSDNNKLKDYGPITICANSVVYDDNKKAITYSGNVFVIQIHNKKILCNKPKQTQKEIYYFTRDNSLTFKQLQQKWLEQAKSLCSQEKECNFISGQELTIQLDKDKNIKTLTVSSNKNEKSNFYTYPLNTNPDYKNSKEVTDGPIEGKSKQVIYDVTKKTLTFYKKAEAYQNKNEYKGDKIIFDITHGLISIPGSADKRSKITLDGISEQTKVDLGLKPIKDYQKKQEKHGLLDG